MFYASLYFLGQYRPVYVEAETAGGAIAALYGAAAHCTRDDVQERLRQLWCMYLEHGDKLAGISTEHGRVGASLRAGHRDTWLDAITDTLPACEGITY